MIRNIFKKRQKVDIPTIAGNGVQIIDVRSESEYRQGHVEGSLNIPLPLLRQHLHLLPKDKPLITCCASGRRSASAVTLLKAKGFSEVYNGGSWVNLKNELEH